MDFQTVASEADLVVRAHVARLRAVFIRSPHVVLSFPQHVLFTRLCL